MYERLNHELREEGVEPVKAQHPYMVNLCREPVYLRP